MFLLPLGVTLWSEYGRKSDKREAVGGTIKGTQTFMALGGLALTVLPIIYFVKQNKEQ